MCEYRGGPVLVVSLGTGKGTIRNGDLFVTDAPTERARFLPRGVLVILHRDSPEIVECPCRNLIHVVADAGANDAPPENVCYQHRALMVTLCGRIGVGTVLQERPVGFVVYRSGIDQFYRRFEIFPEYVAKAVTALLQCGLHRRVPVGEQGVDVGLVAPCRPIERLVEGFDIVGHQCVWIALVR